MFDFNSFLIKFYFHVKKEYGEDRNGHVRGFSGHINKTSARVTTSLRKVIEREKSKNNQFADEVVSVRQEFEEKLEVEASTRRRLEERIGAFESREGPHGINVHHAFPSNASFSQVKGEKRPLPLSDIRLPDLPYSFGLPYLP
ncbi:hypothetical protein GIB67_011315 [Kingdonia uniflora]|uniref:Uncharacterized protein n=1 Tax=Kingdonia uniflora TaxID=39325 RepID=A0A7J7MNV1_9MAGN|nr:hypothetical protein GIB67_011315 [Kingdonia uniflora]